jgi:hypothetical protein
LSVEDYFELLREAIAACLLVQSFDIRPSKRSDYEALINGEITFADGSILYWREFVDVQAEVDRDMYSYQYMTASKELIFRYDNTEHHKKLNLPNYPHHKHDGSQDNIVSSNAPTLAEVLEEIEGMLE